jgi:hypothetical protein
VFILTNSTLYFSSDEKHNVLFVNINTTGCPLSHLYMQVELERVVSDEKYSILFIT